MKVFFTWMYGDGDGYYTSEIDPEDYNTSVEVINRIYKKCLDYDIDTIKDQKNDKMDKRLTDEELLIFEDLYEDIPDIGGFKKYDYVHVSH